MYTFLLDHNKQPVMPVPYNSLLPLFKTDEIALYSRKPQAFIFRANTRTLLSGSLSLNLIVGETSAGVSILHDNLLIWAGVLDFNGVSNPIGFTIAWVKKLTQRAPIASIKMELWKYSIDWDWSDYPQDLDRERMSEIRHFLLERYNGQCQYCGNPGYDIEHIVPKCKGGTNALSNLTLACRDCNGAKSHQSIWEFLIDSPSLAEKILDNAKKHKPRQEHYTNHIAKEVYKGLGEKLPSVSLIASSVPEKIHLLRRLASCQDVSLVPLWLQSCYLNATKKITIRDITPIVITRHDNLND